MKVTAPQQHDLKDYQISNRRGSPSAFMFLVAVNSCILLSRGSDNPNTQLVKSGLLIALLTIIAFSISSHPR